ncbi:MAG: radical SAM family heme chaperone HemW [Planctomycetota bacterium]
MPTSSKEPRPNRSCHPQDVALGASARPATTNAAPNPLVSAIAEGCLGEHGVSLYVHLPFCVKKCRYCDFNSYAWKEQDLDRHVDAVLLETQRRASGLKPQTVFFGGGTPTLLGAERIARLLQGMQEHTGFRDSAAEVTMEANPESLDLEVAQAAAEGGVNRFSIGFQSLRPDVLEAYDRVHSPEDSLRAFEAARAAGVGRINVDLIYAFPGQDPESWFADLKTVQDLKPEHLSCYELSYEPGTALTRLRDVGRWEQEDPDLCLELFEETRRRNEAAGYFGYEVSAFAKEGEASRHNLAYWRSLDYVGIGAGAAGWKDGVRRRNQELPDVYEQMVFAGEDPVDQHERSTQETILFDGLMMGLRLQHEGVSLPRLRRISGIDLMDRHGEDVRRTCEEGLLELVEEDGEAVILRTTPRGFLLLDDILQRFLPEPPTLPV